MTLMAMEFSGETKNNKKEEETEIQKSLKSVTLMAMEFSGEEEEIKIQKTRTN